MTTGGQGLAGRPGPPAKVVETHVSVLIFLGDRVYKLRKPVRFDFVDFRRRAARLADCRREVTLNRRLAPDVYLGVADVSIEGRIADHMVVMRRLPEDRRLAVLAERPQELAQWVRPVARTLVEFHARAARSPDISAAATGNALRASWEANFAEVDPFVGSVLDAAQEASLRQLVGRWIDGRESLLEQRIADGHVCDGHGDLQADDIFCLDDGVRVLDCLEFSDRLRHCDVVADMAFLAMDLERLGQPEAARRLLAEYQELAGDRWPVPLVHHYCAARAYVRAKVACLRFAQGVAEAADQARGLHALALGHLRQARVTLVLVGGLPGSGKSTLAWGLATARGWTVLRSDQIRREGRGSAGATGGRHPATAYREGDYRPTATAATYEELLHRAQALLEAGESVVLDASFVDARWRSAARAVAERTSSELVEICCQADEPVAVSRIEHRRSQGADASEATPEIRRAMSLEMDPWLTAAVVDTSSSPPDQVLAEAVTLAGLD